MHVFSVDLPAFVGQPWRHEPQRMQLPSVYECTGSSSAPSARKPALDRVDARAASRLRSRTPSTLLDPVVVRVEVGDGERLARRRSSGRSPRATSRRRVSCARSATFVLIVVVPPTQRPARNATTSPLGSGAKPERPAERSCVAFASQRSKSVGGQVRPASSRSTSRAALRELARDHAAAGAGPDHDDVERVASRDPQRTTSPCRGAVASGELKSISAHAPGRRLPGATKSL